MKNMGRKQKDNDMGEQLPIVDGTRQDKHEKDIIKSHERGDQDKKSTEGEISYKRGHAVNIIRNGKTKIVSANKSCCDK